jgi:hypothetical protein
MGVGGRRRKRTRRRRLVGLDDPECHFALTGGSVLAAGSGSGSGQHRREDDDGGMRNI